MPLGKLSKMQIAKGFEVLEEIEAAINQKKGKARLEELSSKFFTTIPHNFGRNRPPTMDMDIVKQKKEMLMVDYSAVCRLCAKVLTHQEEGPSDTKMLMLIYTL